MHSTALPAYIQALLTPEAFVHHVDEVHLLQTHISYVLLAGDLVYKFKKPVDFGFLDFSSLAKRLYFCEQELLLNRRLCPDIYLGLVQVTREGEHIMLDGTGEVIEYGVKMKRMPEERMMINVIKAGKIGNKDIKDLVDVLVPFYKRADRNPRIDTFGTAKAVSVNVLENFDQTQSFIDKGALSRDQFETISTYARSVLANDPLFEDRIRGGNIRDCHGDLYSANICLAEKVYIYDCIEFNERFRYCDVASDVAFLAMDLDFHGLEELGKQFIEFFCQQSGDDSLSLVLPFYKCYRAYVRGKIGLFTAADPAVDAKVREENIALARQYFQLAEKYATM